MIPLFHSQEVSPVISDLNPGGEAKTSKTVVEDIAPPAILMKYPPLAFFLNNCLTALNYFREFSLVTIYESVSEVFLSSFERLVDNLMENCLVIRERGNKFFGEGYMSNLGTTVAVGRPSNATKKVTEKLDCLYAQSIAFDLIPHLLFCLLLSFRKLSFSTIKAFQLKNQSLVTNNKHVLNDMRQGKELLGAALAKRVEKIWNSLLQGKLLDGNQFIGSNVTFLPSFLSTMPKESSLSEDKGEKKLNTPAAADETIPTTTSPQPPLVSEIKAPSQELAKED